MGRKVNEVKRGFQKAGLWLLGGAWLGLVFAGMAIAFTPSPHPPALGWVLIAMAATVAFVTMDRWVRIFPGLLAYGVLGSVLALVDGHVVNHPEVLVSRPEGAAMIAFFSVAAVLSLTFVKRKLQVSDRVALLTFVVCFFWQAAVPRLRWVALGVGFCFLLFAWLYDRVQRRRDLGPRLEPRVTRA